MSAATPVIFDDGSKALVPQAQLSAALKDGGKVAQAMQFDDGSKAYVALDRVHDAIHDGGQLLPGGIHQPTVAMQPTPLSIPQQQVARTAENLTDAATHVADVGKKVANDVYDVSAPNIATQLYRKLKGLPNTLDKLPEKMVLAFLSAGGLPEGELTEPAVAAEAGASKAAPEAASASAATATSEAAAARPKSVNLDLPRTLSGESALRQVLGGQDNANLLKIARSRGINVTQEAQLKPGVADSKLIEKIVNDFSDDELSNIRDTYIESTRMGPQPFKSKIGAEANKTLSLQTYFPEVKIPAATVRRTQTAVTAAKSTPESADAGDLVGALKASVAMAKKKKLADLAGAAH